MADNNPFVSNDAPGRLNGPIPQSPETTIPGVAQPAGPITPDRVGPNQGPIHGDD